MIETALATQGNTFEVIREKFLDLGAAVSKLPAEEREQYKRAQESVVNARRNAETHEGLLQLG